MKVLITGGMAGIGRAFAVDRASRGDHVQVVGRAPARLDAFWQELNGAPVELFQCDLSSVADIKRFAERYRS